MEPQNAYSVGRTGKQLAQLCQLLPVHQAVKYDLVTIRDMLGQKKMSRGQKTHVNDLEKMFIIHMFILGKSMDTYVKYCI